MKSSVSITCAPVGHGDSILIAYGPAQQKSRILIDGGPAHRYPALADALSRIPSNERRFELFVVTHVDADHIDGALILLQDQEAGVEIDEVWFNGWPQLPEAPGPPSFGPEQGAFLEVLLQHRAWNKAFGDGDAAVAPDGGDVPVKHLPGGAKLSILSPRADALRRLRARWKKVLREAGLRPGDWEEAGRRLAERRAYAPPVGAEPAFGPRIYGSDAAVANGSSIAFVLEYGGCRVLLAADAHPTVLTDGLRRMAAREGVQRLPLDAMKLSHHGSMANIDAELLKAVDCSRFLVSTNGDYFGHPDPETITLLGRTCERPEVRFNYRSNTTVRWESRLHQREAGIRAVYPPEGQVLELAAEAAA
jgi:beta-lactamase superfamily II metal-dependent hydrolase